MPVKRRHRPAAYDVCMAHDCDVIIVGAGPAGLALASALADTGLRTLNLEQATRATIEAPAEDGRDIALTHRARRVMEGLGMWERLAAEAIAPLKQARVVDGDATSASLHFTSTGTGLEALGWLVPNHLIRQAAWQAASARERARFEFGAAVNGLQLQADEAAVTLSDGRRFSAPLVVAADSRFSSVRRMAGIGASVHDFARSVVVGRVRHENESEGIAWECFRYGNTLAMLPMNERQCSAVVTVPSSRTAEWLGLDDAGFAARVQAQAPAALGRLQAVGPRHHYPLVGVYAHRFSAARFALIGDAAVGMHPVTAHGYNFGLYGVEVLTRELARCHALGHDIGSAAVLQRYADEHRRTTLPTYLGTNALVKLFTDEHGPAKVARRALLAASENLPGFSGVVKAAITQQLTGRRALPAFLRPLAPRSTTAPHA